MRSDARAGFRLSVLYDSHSPWRTEEEIPSFLLRPWRYNKYIQHHDDHWLESAGRVNYKQVHNLWLCQSEADALH